MEVGIPHQGRNCHVVFLKGILYGFQKFNGKRAVDGNFLSSRGLSRGHFTDF